MNKDDVKVRMKVVPFQKTVGVPLRYSNNWSFAKEDNQPYLYVVEWDDLEDSWVLGNELDNGGDYFNSKDFDLYVDIKDKKEEDKMAKLTLKEQLKILQDQVSDVQDKIKVKEASNKINELIATFEVKDVLTITATQYISKGKINLQLEKHDKTMNCTAEYSRKGNKITCKFMNEYTTGVGVSKCDSEDDFDYRIGMQLAELRARSDFYNEILAKRVKELYK